MSITIRLATPADIPTLKELIPSSARGLSHGYYTQEQTEAAIRYVFGVDSQLINDATYYVAVEDEQIVGCGGWSWRRTLYGGDQRPMGAGEVLDPAVDAARIRAFFVATSHARQGIGARILTTCAEAALARGFSRLELMSTLPGILFYRKLGFQEVQRVIDTLPDGTTVEFAQMTRPGTVPGHTAPEDMMELGAFSVSLAVKDIEASKRFYEKLGFTVFAGDQSQNWLILKNGDHAIGLFQGMFDKNILTFNPGWSSDAQPLRAFTDVRELQRQLKDRGVNMITEADERSTGPASFMIVDPDGNTILVDQHV